MICPYEVPCGSHEKNFAISFCHFSSILAGILKYIYTQLYIRTSTHSLVIFSDTGSIDLEYFSS